MCDSYVVRCIEINAETRQYCNSTEFALVFKCEFHWKESPCRVIRNQPPKRLPLDDFLWCTKAFDIFKFQVHIYRGLHSGSMQSSKMIKASWKYREKRRLLTGFIFSKGMITNPAPWFAINRNKVNLVHTRDLLCKCACADTNLFIMRVNPVNEQRESGAICIISEVYGVPEMSVSFCLPERPRKHISAICAYALRPYCSVRWQASRQLRLGLSLRCFLWVRSTIGRH